MSVRVFPEIIESAAASGDRGTVISEVVGIGLVDPLRIATLLVVLWTGVQIENFYEIEIKIFSIASGALINLAYLIYIYLIFYPRPEDVDV